MGALDLSEDKVALTTVQDAKGLFPVTSSILSANALLAEVARAYAIDAPVSCQFLKPGFNDTYLLTTRDNRYIVRVYGAHRRTPSDIAYELELVSYLAAKDVPVSVPIAGKDGRLTRPLAAPEGTRPLALFTYAEGKPLSWDDDDHSYLAGQLAAKIHTATDEFTSQQARFRLDFETLIDVPLATIRPFFAHRPDDWFYLQRLATEVRARVAEASRGGLDWGVCHGDLGNRNIHITPNRMLTIFDFDISGPGWRAYDLTAVHWVATNAKSKSVWDSFLKGYTEARSLSARDLDAVPLFFAMSHLWSMGLRAGDANKWGFPCMGDYYLDWELAFFRKWEAEHLKEK